MLRRPDEESLDCNFRARMRALHQLPHWRSHPRLTPASPALRTSPSASATSIARSRSSASSATRSPSPSPTPAKPRKSSSRSTTASSSSSIRKTDASQPLGWMHVCFEAGDLNALIKYYDSTGLKAAPVRKAAAGNLISSTNDPEGRVTEFTQYMPGSRHTLDRGQHLGANRLSIELMGIDLPVKRGRGGKGVLRRSWIRSAGGERQCAPDRAWRSGPVCSSCAPALPAPSRSFSFPCPTPAKPPMH
jgi:hypothetical protein